MYGKENYACCVPGCTTKEPSNEKVYWFKPPSDENLRKMWSVAIDYQSETLGNNDIVCQKHFSKDHFKTKDGKVMLSNGKLELKPDAVPYVQFYKTCCVPHCGRSGKMYSFPIANSTSFRLWLYMIKNPNLKDMNIKEIIRHQVCKTHFEADCFEKDDSLNNLAAPTLFLPEGFPATYLSQESPAMYPYKSYTCAYLNCNVKSFDGKLLFSFPADPERCIAWLKACGRPELIKSPSETVRNVRHQSIGVCEDHFAPQCYGSTLKELKPDALPNPCPVFQNILIVDNENIPSLQLTQLIDNEKVHNMAHTDIYDTLWECVLNILSCITNLVKSSHHLNSPDLNSSDCSTTEWKGQIQINPPYAKYKYLKSSMYGLNNDYTAAGESFKIHTAIIIDDDDEYEKSFATPNE
ncbi:hypothetical protein NQ317_013062 [Molorchus minor]|uniref:THAP-type domain-containing protein n=1 Tax=Molorchus minor TaxID=1323400 RepID=A0ABQ9IU07_9CUCU|nr:hypothetical protein NQ317_013062 [Molorchus minor]